MKRQKDRFFKADGCFVGKRDDLFTAQQKVCGGLDPRYFFRNRNRVNGRKIFATQTQHDCYVGAVSYAGECQGSVQGNLYLYHLRKTALFPDQIQEQRRCIPGPHRVGTGRAYAHFYYFESTDRFHFGLNLVREKSDLNIIPGSE